MHIHWLDEVGQVIALNSPVIFPAISWNTLSTYQRVYLLTVPLEYVDLYGVSEVLFGTPLTHISVDKLYLQLEQDMIENAPENKDLHHSLTRDQWQDLLKALRVQRSALLLHMDSVSCHEWQVGSAQLPVFDGFLDIVQGPEDTVEHVQLHEGVRFWLYAYSLLRTEALGFSIVNNQMPLKGKSLLTAPDYLRSVKVSTELPSAFPEILLTIDDTYQDIVDDVFDSKVYEVPPVY